MKRQRDILSFIIFFLLLFFLAVTLFLKFLNWADCLDVSLKNKTVYVNLNRITVPNYYAETENTAVAEKETEISPIISPENLNAYFYFQKSSEFPAKDLEYSSDLSLEELKNTLTENMTDSIENAKRRNIEIKNLQNMQKIREFETDAYTMFRKQTEKTVPFRTKSYLSYIAYDIKKDVMNTKNNRTKADSAKSDYSLKRNSYLNDYYLYYLYKEAFINLEQEKNENFINSKFDSFEKENRNRIDRQISYSKKIIRSIINRIETDETNRLFYFNNINDPKYLQKPVILKLNNLNLAEKEKENKKKIILSIAKDNRFTVTFDNTKAEDKTEYFQNIIDRYGYLY